MMIRIKMIAIMNRIMIKIPLRYLFYTTFKVMKTSEVKRIKRVPCKQVLQEIFEGKFIELKNGMLYHK